MDHEDEDAWSYRSDTFATIVVLLAWGSALLAFGFCGDFMGTTGRKPSIWMAEWLVPISMISALASTYAVVTLGGAALRMDRRLREMREYLRESRQRS